MEEDIYKTAGVNLSAAQSLKKRIRSLSSSTLSPNVLEGSGSFSGLYELAGFREPIIVSSTDGVGTKLKLAAMMNKYDTIGEDLVNACVNDVIVCGAKPLFFLDYLALGELNSCLIENLLSGMVRACRESECSLIGGETAQMPGLYGNNEFDMAGFVVGVVEKSNIIDTNLINQGDTILGLHSNGLHTNGYSLVRHILELEKDPTPLTKFRDDLGETLGEALLTPHRSYYKLIRPAIPFIKGIAHITGGGLTENVPRILPKTLAAQFDTTSWRPPNIFKTLQNLGDISTTEMYRVFNMGLGMIIVCDPSNIQTIKALIPEVNVVGEVTTSLAGQRINL